MQMIQSSTTSATDDTENGKCHNGEGATGAAGTNKVNLLALGCINGRPIYS